MEIRPARRSDVVALCGDTYRQSMKAIVVEHKGKPVGIAGVLRTSPAQCFSAMDDILRTSPKTILKVAKALSELLDESQRPVFAIASEDETTAARFLTHIGFKYLTTTSQGEVYQWHKQSQR